MKIIDTFSNKEIEISKDPNIYVCGPTTYDYVHIGNIRPIIIFDIFNRVLSLTGKVTYVNNITDIDDKIIERALKENKNELELSDFYAKDYLKILKQLKVIKPTFLPKVSDNIEYIKKFIEKIVENSFAYASETGVYFSVEKWDKYNKLTNLSLDKLKTNNLSSDKKNSIDFALWKFTNDLGIKFNSKWGKGRPGWHTECAALISKIFDNQTIDVHGGGIDLRFPHHINEWAQYYAYNNKPITKVWMHVGHVNFEENKMSKSLGNVILVNDFLKKYSSNVLRFLLISNFYTKPINVNENSINNAQVQVQKIKNILIKILWNYNIDFEKIIYVKDEKFLEIINNNLDIPNSISLLNFYIKSINKNYDLDIIEKFLFILKILGISYTINFDILNKIKKKEFLNDDKNLLIQKVVEI